MLAECITTHKGRKIVMAHSVDVNSPAQRVYVEPLRTIDAKGLPVPSAGPFGSYGEAARFIDKNPA